MLNILKMKRFLIEKSYHWVLSLYGKYISPPGFGIKQFGPSCQDLRADIFPVQTGEQTKNIYHMANTFQIWKELAPSKTLLNLRRVLVYE